MASEDRSREMASTEVERGSVRGLLDNRNGSEDLVMNEQAFQAAPEHPSETQLLRSPRHVLTPLPKRIVDEIRQASAKRLPKDFVTLRHEPRPAPADGLGHFPAASSAYSERPRLPSPTSPYANTVVVGQELHTPLASQHSSIAASGGSSDSGSGEHVGHTHGSLGSGSAREHDRTHRRQMEREERRREEREEAQRREAREEARWQAERADRRAAEDRAERRAELQAEQQRADRREDRAHALQIAALARTPHRLGLALTAFRPFDGANGADGAAYYAEFLALLGTHSIPPEMRAKEFFLKLTGHAAKWYASEYQNLPAGDFPPFGVMCSAFLQEYSPRYQAADAFQALQGATRKPGTTGLEALQSLAELELRLRRLGVENPGPEEQLAYRLQNLLSSTELQSWTSLANASDIAEATLNELELPSTSATLSRHSCSPETRETFFARRSAHLRNFLREQGKAVAGGRSGGSAPARAAVAASPDAGSAPPLAAVVAPPTPSLIMTAACNAARVAAIQQWTHTLSQAKAHNNMPPEYYGTNKDPKLLSENQAAVARREAAQSCWRCPENMLVAGQPHWECRFHGVHASDVDRRSCPVVPGAANFGRGSRR